MHPFISTLTSKNLQNQNLQQFQYTLLSRILLTAALLSFLTASAFLLGWLPLGDSYAIVLYVYSIGMLLIYFLRKEALAHYHRAVHVLVFSSLFMLGVMTVSIPYDAFRLGWFFLLSFSAFILMGRGYGFMVTVLIIVLVLLLYLLFDLEYSVYAIATFVGSLLAFALFTHYFLSKVQHDAIAFEEMVQTEVDKRQTQEQILLRKYRMANMGEMIDAIAHQWRQPLAQGSMILLNMEEEIDNKIYLKKKITQLSELNQHMSQTIDDFRHLLHDSKNKTTFDTHSTIAEVLTLMKNQLQYIEIQYTNRVAHQMVGYKNEFIQVLVILLSNAVEVLHMRDIKDKKISLILEENDEVLRIHIEDNAGGIEASVEEKLFDPYITTKESVGGTGLGLYIAKIIIEETMHGKLSVKQGLEGARFTVEMRKE